MKNLQYFPFERNRYYYGKLLTEQDFTSEQKYMNDKRRMLNRFLHGTGIAAGLKVVRLDEKSISLEAGLALDGAGREIVVDKPSVFKLDTLDGFEAVAEGNNRGYAYLCIEYDEKESSPSHNAAAVSSQNGTDADYDKSREGYHLYLTDQEYQEGDDTIASMFLQRTVLYRDGELCITQESPRFAESGKTFEVRLLIENAGSGKEVRVEFAEGLECAGYQGENRIFDNFTERLADRNSIAVRSYELTALPVDQGAVELSLLPEQLSVYIGQEKMNPLKETVIRIPVARQDIFEELKELYVSEAMNAVQKNSYPQGIYLAKIYMVKSGMVYLIDNLEQAPFGQYVYSSFLNAGLIHALIRENRELKERLGRTAGAGREPEPKEAGKERTVSEGTAEIQLGIGGKRGERFFSDEIFHGLGLGPVTIELGIEEEHQQLFGSAEIFEKSGPRAELAAKADLSRGSFVIGVRLLEATGQQSLRICWRVQAGRREKEDNGERRLSIRPGKLELKVRQTSYLEAVTEHLSGATILWEVKTPQGGTISRDGLYTAPNQPGVYEISAWVQEIPSIRASLFVIVRE